MSGLWMYFAIRASGFTVSTEDVLGLSLLFEKSIINQTIGRFSIIDMCK